MYGTIETHPHAFLTLDILFIGTVSELFSATKCLSTLSSNFVVDFHENILIDVHFDAQNSTTDITLVLMRVQYSHAQYCTICCLKWRLFQSQPFFHI